MSYVYLMRSGERYKIGQAGNVGQRWRTFRTADPDIRIEHVIPTNQANRLERELHRCFDRKHIDLEWFALSSADVAFIKSLGGHPGRWIEQEQRRRRFWRRMKRWGRWMAGVALRLALMVALALILLWLFSAAAQPVRNALLHLR